jgi:adenylate cyclase
MYYHSQEMNESAQIRKQGPLPTADHGNVPSEAVREQLAAILASETFARSERLSEFLRFLVENAIVDGSASPKEYVIGVEVYGRPSSFDPHFEPIVRVEARRLRRKLDQYYHSEGRNDPLVIELPKRTYIPVFRRRQRVSRSERIWNGVRGLGKWEIFTLCATVLFTGAAAYWLANPLSSRVQVQREPVPIVVLPFVDLSPNKDQEYFSDGITEEIIERLARVEGLQVVSRTSAFQFKGKTADVREIGEQLNARLIIEGSVRKTGDKLRIIGQLVSADNGYHLWSKTYECGLPDAFTVPGEVARAVAERLQLTLPEVERADSPQPYNQNPETYGLYLKGLHFAQRWTGEGLREGIQYFEQVIQKEPDHAPAYAGLAQCYSLLALHEVSAPKEVMPKAREAALKALGIDSSLSHAHLWLGFVKAVYEWDWAGAQEAFEHALRLDPRDANVREIYVLSYLAPMGRLDEALEQMQKAHTLDPVSPRVHFVTGLTYHFRRQYDQAIAQYREALELAPHFYPTYLALSSAYEQSSMYENAVEVLEQGRASWMEGITDSLLGHTYALMGERDKARKQIDKLTKSSTRRYISSASLASIHAALGDKDLALDLLNQACEERATFLIYLRVNPRWDNLRSDPRFTALLGKIHLGQESSLDSHRDLIGTRNTAHLDLDRRRISRWRALRHD